MPPGAGRDTDVPLDVARASKWSESYANPDVLEFIKRARAARMTGNGQRRTED